jgi:hypothetical protein
MYIVAGRTGQSSATPLKAPAGPEERHLIAVNIRFGGCLFGDAGMTTCTKIETGWALNLLVPVGFPVTSRASDA